MNDAPDVAVARVRRFTRLAVNYLLHAVFGIDPQTRLQARALAVGATELALDTAADHDVLTHPGSTPLLNLVRLFTAQRASASAARRTPLAEI